MLEAQLRDLLSSQLHVLERGLTLVAKEKYIPSTLGTRSFIDLLARDVDGKWVLIELKRSDAAARDALHEVYKYVEGVKTHLRARDDEIRAIIVSTEWKELFVPFFRFVHSTDIAVKGIRVDIGPLAQLSATDVIPMTITRGRILSPWHEISLYKSEERLKQGIASYDASCRTKGIDDYLLIILKAPEEFFEKAVHATANVVARMQGRTEGATDAEIEDMSKKMDRLDWMIYFVPQLLTAEKYLEIIEGTPDLFDEAKDFQKNMGEEEALCSLQEYALDATRGPRLIEIWLRLAMRRSSNQSFSKRRDG